MMWWSGSEDWWVGVLMMLVFWGALITLVFLLVRGSGSRNSGDRHSTPLEILAERFARGEISKEEYEERKSVLQSDGSQQTT